MSNIFKNRFVGTDDLLQLGFKAVGPNVQIADTCTIVGQENIAIGQNVRIDHGTTIIAHLGSLTIGSYVHIGGGCHLSARGGITLSDFSGLSQGVKIYSVTDDYSGQHLTNPMIPSKFTDVQIAEVILRPHVIVGANSVILPGVEIGRGSAVGALSLVSRSLPEYGIFAGSPVRKISERSDRTKVLEEAFLTEEREQ